MTRSKAKAQELVQALAQTHAQAQAKELMEILNEQETKDFVERAPNVNFLNGIICFNHFLDQLDVLQTNDILYNLIARCAAARLRTGFPLFDLLIPVILPDGSIGSILIQVKNNKNASNNSHTESMLQRDVFAENSLFPTDIRWDNDHCLKILMSLGKQLKKKPEEAYFHENGTLVVSGISKKVYPCLNDNISSKLEVLLDLQRTEMKDIIEEDENIVTQTFQGSISEKRTQKI